MKRFRRCSRKRIPGHHLLRDVGHARECGGGFGGATHAHFACHGRFDAANPLKSTLYLADAETLTLRDLLDGHFDVSPVRLAILSACQTGLADFRNAPDELVGFSAGFIQAGVTAVITTLWPVDDLATAVLLRQFYRYHLEGQWEPGPALDHARKWLRNATAGEMELISYYERLFDASGGIDENARDWGDYYRTHPEVRPFQHPSYWGAFVVSGV